MRWLDVLELWFDFSCPYAYLASRRAKLLGPAIDWRPMLLGGVFRGSGAGDGPMATNSPQKQAHNYHDMHRWAALFGEPFRMPPAHPMRTVLALRTLLALPHDHWPAAIEAIFASYWQRGEDVSRPETLARALAAAGIPEAAITAAARRADDPAIKDELRQRTDEAIALGIFGAPAWVMRGRGEPLLVWGQDRMPWVEAMLDGWSLSGPPPGGPRPFAPTEPAVAGKAVDVYFDVASPFAYLGLTQLPGLAAIGITPRLVPILLGALFRDIQQVNVPLLAMPPAKQRYVGREMQRWASWWGVAFEPPRKFPQRTVAAQRLCLIAAREGFAIGARVATALGRAMWAEQRDLEDDATLLDVLAGAGLDEGVPAAWLARTQDPEIKAALADNTARARAAGVFGVPTFIVHDQREETGAEPSDAAGSNAARGIDGKQLFWGQDRLALVAKALAGWSVPVPEAVPARTAESAPEPAT